MAFEFEAHVSEVASELTGTFSIGQSIFGRYAFDSEAVDTVSSNDIGAYAYDGFTFSIDSYTGSSSVGQIQVSDDVASGAFDFYRVQNLRVPGGILADAIGAWTPIELSLQLTDSTATAFDTDALPLNPPDMADFPDFRGFRLSFAENPDAGPVVSLRGTITSLSFSHVPEPSTGWLLAAGLAGLVARRRHRRATL